MKRFCKLISDYMGVLVLLAAVAAMLWPEVFSHLKPTLISPLLGVIMFGMGLTLRWEDFRVVFSRPRDVMIGCLAQFTVMPLLAYVLTPLLVWLLAGKTVDVDVMAMFLSILWVVILPIVAGLLVKRLWPRLTEGATAYLPALSSIAIAMIVLIVISASAHKLFAGGLLIVIVVMLHNIGGLTIGYLIGRLLRLATPKRRALSIEVGMQNSGLASSLAVLHFAAYPLATIPGAVFSVWHNISGALVARLYQRK